MVVGCEGICASLTVLAPCGFDSMRGNRARPLRTATSDNGASHSYADRGNGREKSNERPSCLPSCTALSGM